MGIAREIEARQDALLQIAGSGLALGFEAYETAKRFLEFINRHTGRTIFEMALHQALDLRCQLAVDQFMQSPGRFLAVYDVRL